MVAQVVHAAGESAIAPVVEGTHAVVLSVPDEAALLRAAARLEDRGIKHKIIFEVDAPWTGQATAIGLAPVCDRTPVRRALANLPLLK